MALFNSRKRHDSSQPAPVSVSAPAPEPTTAEPAQVSSAPLGAGLRLVSVPAPEAAATQAPEAALPAPEALRVSEESRADDLRGLPLGTILYRRGLVEQSELEEALAAGMESGERLGEVLIRRGLVAEEEVGRCLAAQQGLPFLNGEDLTLDPDVAALLPAAEARELGAIPVSIQDDVVLVVRPDPSSHQRGRLADVLGRKVTEAVVSRADFASLLERLENGSVGTLVPVAESTRETEEQPSPALLPSSQGPEAEPESDAESHSGWFGSEPAREQHSPAVELASTGEDLPQSAGAGAEMHEPELKEEQQMEQSWTNAESDEHSEPAVWHESSNGAESGVTDPGGWAEPAQEETASQAEHGTAEGAHLAPVPDAAFDGASTEDWNAPAETDEQGWDDPAGEAADEDGWWGVTSSPDSDLSSADSETASLGVDAEVPDSGRIEELGAQHEASLGRIDELLVRIREGATTYSDLRAQIAGLTDNLRTTEETLADREHRLGALSDDHAAAQQRIDELVHELQEREDALDGLGQRVEDLTGRLGSAEERLDEREQRLAELDASLGERVRHIEALSAQVERRDHALSAFEEKLAAIAAQFAADGA